MSLVTGIGDEVISVTITFLIMTVITLVWRSTRVRERAPISVVTTTFTVSADHVIPSDETSQTTPVEDGGGPRAEPGTLPEEAEEALEDDADCVTIRLRFIDETQFEVRSPLSVTLGQFKSRHLRPRHAGPGVTSPIQPNDRVRLIFNGKVLHSDSSTLTQLGFQHNCTVHCLVQRENVTPNVTVGHGGVTLGSDVPGADLDLSNLCYPVLGTVLFVIWWCQVVYAHYFTFTSTMSLVSLTFLYAASVANAYLNH